VPIQSASALNAYLTAATPLQVNSEIAGSSTAAGEGAQAQGRAGAGLSQEQSVSTAAAVAKPAENETDEASGDASSTQASLPAMYGRNARSVVAGMAGGSLSLFA
jgi:hypothetical protein